MNVYNLVLYSISLQQQLQNLQPSTHQQPNKLLIQLYEILMGQTPKQKVSPEETITKLKQGMLQLRKLREQRAKLLQSSPIKVPQLKLQTIYSANSIASDSDMFSEIMDRNEEFKNINEMAYRDSLNNQIKQMHQQLEMYKAERIRLEALCGQKGNQIEILVFAKSRLEEKVAELNDMNVLLKNELLKGEKLDYSFQTDEQAVYSIGIMTEAQLRLQMSVQTAQTQTVDFSTQVQIMDNISHRLSEQLNAKEKELQQFRMSQSKSKKLLDEVEQSEFEKRYKLERQNIKLAKQIKDLFEHIRVLEQTSPQAQLNAHNMLVRSTMLDLIQEFTKQFWRLDKQARKSKDPKQAARYDKQISQIMGRLLSQCQQVAKGFRDVK